MDRPAGALAGFPDQAANRVADVLHCALHGRAGKPMATTVFGLFLNLCAARRHDDSAQMLEISRHLVAAAPQLTAAHALYAVAAARAAMEANSPARAAPLRTLARASAARALQLDPRSAEANLALALSYGENGHWLERERDFRTSIRLDPDAPGARNLYIDLLRDVGRWNDATDLNAGTIAADPFSAIQLSRMAVLTAARGDLPGAAALLERAGLINPAEAAQTRWNIAFWRDDPSSARRQLAVQTAGAPTRHERACFDRYLGRLIDKARSPAGLPALCSDIDPQWRVRMLAREGDIDGAFAEVRGPASTGPRSTTFLFYPEMAAFQRDRRFMPLAKRLGLIDYWRASGRWPDFCAQRDLPYDCRAAAAATL
jgi:tetratricopeptide (TPR) repeat protein